MSDLDVNWGEAPHGLDTGFDSSSATTRTGLSGHRGCSQVLCHGPSSGHVDSFGIEVAQRRVVRGNMNKSK